MEKSVKTLIAEKFLGGNENFSDTDRLRNQGITSLMFIELILLLEKEFGIEIPDEEITHERFSTVKNITEYIRSKIKKRVKVRRSGKERRK